VYSCKGVGVDLEGAAAATVIPRRENWAVVLWN
jgi:hypothetical protein